MITRDNSRPKVFICGNLDLFCFANFLGVMALQRWLNVVMDLMVLGIAMFVISFAVWRKNTTSGQIGIALNVVLQANLFLLRLVEAWTTIETSLGAVSRLRAFEKDVLPEEKPGEDHLPTVEWPAHGASTNSPSTFLS